MTSELNRPGDSGATEGLLAAAGGGNTAAWGQLLNRHRDRLRRMLALRLDDRLRGRVDASDVLQETFIEASQRLPDYLARPDLPFYLWLRFLAGQRLLITHRRHLGTRQRDAGREVPLDRGMPEASSAALAARLLGREGRPSEAVVREEIRLRLQDALNVMDPLDREVLALRHFEQLSNAETARVLGVREAAASKRYIRALDRLRDILTTAPGGSAEWLP
jgi:RNA polymerase sigma-70 factor (ECF subfamily)